MLRLTHVYLIVDDQEQAKNWYVEKLGWKVHTDAPFEQGRWITMHLEDQPELEISLFPARPEDEEGLLRHSRNVAGWVFEVEDCIAEVKRLEEAGVKILLQPETLPWGIQAAFADLYGNQFLLVQPIEMKS